LVVKSKGQVAAQPVDKATKTEIEWLIDRHDGAPNFELRKFRIRPGGSIPKHYHHDIEHEQYVLAGDYEVGIGEEVHRLKAGDSLYIPAGTVHWYINGGKKDAEFLCIVPKKEKYDAVYLDETAASPPKRRTRQADSDIPQRRS
jgi:quercetin dioxygenase-like cupin family protein